ncbi:MAG: efflux RND transporter periplasmic adaptor subunit [Gemmatimonadota bacterium]|nr:MAG: efflux RND transporter periplasmic adaptor subunit [Gemmatimonadota bacterium]
MKTRRYLTVGAVIFALINAACEEAEEGRPFQVVAARQQTLSISAEAAGILEPVTTVEIKSKASGEILQLPVETGDLVEQGQLLVQVDRVDARQGLAQAEADLEVAQARLKIAESQLERAQRMREQEIISDQDFEQAELEHANARAQLVRSQAALETARERMSETTIRAPISGTIIARTVEVGNVISSATQVVGGGTLLMTMADLSEVQVRTLVDETDIGRVQPDMLADISVEAYRDRAFQGRVLKIEPQAQVTQNVTMFPVIIRIANREGLLKPGMSAEVTIRVAGAENVIAVPTQAVHPTDDARDVAELALGIDGASFGNLLAANTPQEAAARFGPAAGSDGQGPQELTREQIRELMQKARSGEQLTPEEQRQVDELRQRFMQGQGPGAGPGQRPQRTNSGTTAGVVFVLRDAEIFPVPVQLGVTDWESIEVISGLQEGDSVCLLPTAALLRDQAELLERFQRFRGSGVPGMQRQGS